MQRKVCVHRGTRDSILLLDNRIFLTSKRDFIDHRDDLSTFMAQVLPDQTAHNVEARLARAFYPAV